MRIHPTAIVEPGAEIDAEARIGPYCTVGAKVELAAGVELVSHVAVRGRTSIGPRTVVHPFASLGGAPQHTGYRGEDTRLVIGADNIIRENVTMSLGTAAGGGVTRIGDRGFFMAGSHVAHDCTVGDRAIFANAATIGGHVVLEEGVFLGGLSAVHQHCRIGAFAFLGAGAIATSNLIPYGSAWGCHAHLDGLNIVGLKRRGVAREAIHDLRAAYRLLFHGEGLFQERVEAAAQRYAGRAEAQRVIAFIRTPVKRPLMFPSR